MGQSQTIQDKAKRDAEFREYMANLDKESKLEENRLADELQALVKRHYETNGWDYARLFGNRQSDYQNYSDWGLDRITGIINSIGKALVASDYPSKEVPGSDKASPGTVEKAKEFTGIFAGDYSLIIARVIALVSGVLSQFSVKSEATRKSELRDLPLSGGLHLFFASSGKVFQAQNFFTNEFIGAFQIVFETYMSVDEARFLGLQAMLAATEREIAILNDLIITLREDQAESLKLIIKKDIKDYKSTKDAYDLALDMTKADRDKVVEQYNKYKSVTDTVDRLMDRLDLTEFERKPAGANVLQIDHLFTTWEASLARRYLKEKLAEGAPKVMAAQAQTAKQNARANATP